MTTLQQLHEIKDFGGLFVDPRFIAALTYLRQNPSPHRGSGTDATMIIKNEGAWCGWFDFANSLEALFKPPAQLSVTERGRPYQQPANPTPK